MEHARRHGYPVPAVHEVRKDALVLDRVEGPTMWEALDPEPDVPVLAGLHEQLHAIPFEGASLLHRDLHPANVILSPAGPVVIDWTNAGAGDPAFDIALVWVIAATADDPRAAGFARDFVGYFPGWERALDDAVAFRLADPNVTEPERLRVRGLSLPTVPKNALH
jgi:tRNA A-37 threonylcarbamoyl transferase component Bud32